MRRPKHACHVVYDVVGQPVGILECRRGYQGSHDGPATSTYLPLAGSAAEPPEGAYIWFHRRGHPRGGFGQEVVSGAAGPGR
jgi:hypothetical protein